MYYSLEVTCTTLVSTINDALELKKMLMRLPLSCFVVRLFGDCLLFWHLAAGTSSQSNKLRKNTLAMLSFMPHLRQSNKKILCILKICLWCIHYTKNKCTKSCLNTHFLDVQTQHGPQIFSKKHTV